MKKILISGSPLKRHFGMEIVLKDGVMQHKARWWLYYLPKWFVKMLLKKAQKYKLTKKMY